MQNIQLHNEPAGQHTRKLWEKAHQVIEEIVHHPFCKRLADGTLPYSAFRHYLGQDSLYIEQDARAFAIVAGRSPDSAAFAFFLNMAKDGLEIERHLHHQLFPAFEVTQPEIMSEACAQYTEFLLGKALNASYPEAVVALLPCFWVYRETGLRIRENATSNNPYRLWLDTYADEIYGEYVNQFIEITEVIMSKANPIALEQMYKVFIHSCIFEKAFFSEAINAKE